MMAQCMKRENGLSANRMSMECVMIYVFGEKRKNGLKKFVKNVILYIK